MKHAFFRKTPHLHTPFPPFPQPTSHLNSGERPISVAQPWRRSHSTLLPITDEHAAPVRRVRPRPTARVRRAVREAAVRALEFEAQGGGVVPEFGTGDRVGRVAGLNPVDHVPDDVVLHAGDGRGAGLAEHPCAGEKISIQAGYK